MELFLFLLAGFSITTIITTSKIFEPFRNRLDNGKQTLKKNFFGLLINCPMCVGFWIGFHLSLFIYSPVLSAFGFDVQNPMLFVTSLVMDGAMLGVTSWIVHMFISLVDKAEEMLDSIDMYYQTLMVEMEEKNKEEQNAKISSNKQIL